MLCPCLSYVTQVYHLLVLWSQVIWYDLLFNKDRLEIAV